MYNMGVDDGYQRGMYTRRPRPTANLSTNDTGMGEPIGNNSFLRNPHIMRNNYGSTYPPVSQIPTKSTRLNDQYFDYGERSYYPTEYCTTNGTSKWTPNQRYRPFGRRVARGTPYYVPEQNREQRREYFTGGSQEYGQQTKVNDEPKKDSRISWKTKNQSKTVPEAAPAKLVGDFGLKGISNFISPSSWYSTAKNVESSHQEEESENKIPSKYSTFDKPYYEQDIDRDIVAGKWDTSANAAYEVENGGNYVDDSYPEVIEKPVKNEWAVPPELNLSIASGLFYTKVCEAVLEKVLQQLCPNSYKANQKSGATSYYTQPQAKPTFNSNKNMTNGFSRYPYTDAGNYKSTAPYQNKTNYKLIGPFQNQTNFKQTQPFQYQANFKLTQPFQNKANFKPTQPFQNKANFKPTQPFQNKAQQLRYNPYKKVNNAPKPLFSQPLRGQNTGRVAKRKTSKKTQESLV